MHSWEKRKFYSLFGESGPSDTHGVLKEFAIYRVVLNSQALSRKFLRFLKHQVWQKKMDVNFDEFFEDEGNLLGTLWWLMQKRRQHKRRWYICPVKLAVTCGPQFSKAAKKCAGRTGFRPLRLNANLFCFISFEKYTSHKIRNNRSATNADNTNPLFKMFDLPIADSFLGITDCRRLSSIKS
uniref:Uncharacterized protein n=1 Tax=Romanomermis culicivorax TaxID=13658 RepID=A0A915KU30_ROMCU